MPTITGSKSGTRPHLELDWSVNSQDIANNRSSVKLKLYLKVDYSIGYSARYTGTLQGASFTSSSGYISKPGRYLLTQRDVWIGHNSDGTKTATLTADYNLNITWGGTYFGKITLSGSANLGTIPRASTLSAFSFSAALKNGVANSIKYKVDRKSGNFRHHIQLRDGNTVVWTWDNQNTDGENTIPLTAANVNTLLGRMKTVTSKTYTLRVATRSGASGGFIGSAVSKTATATVHADVKPTVSAVTVSQTGNSVSTHYLQGKSKVKASFTPTAVGSATIVSSSITVRRKTSNTDVQTINSNSGTTGKTVSLTGTYEARGTTRDSRGRTNNTAWKEFTVTAYSSPVITNFTAVRNATTPTTVNISRAGAHTHLGGLNVLTYTVQRRIGTGSWTNVNTNATGTSTTASFSASSTSTGNSVTTSYEFRMVLTDKFGESAESVVSVSTQRVVLDIHKNEGVGVGKIHERGVLDVDGSAYFAGPVHLDEIVSNHAGHEADLNTLTKTGFYHVGSKAANIPAVAWGFLYVNAGATESGENVSQIYHARSYVSGYLGRGSPVYVRVMNDGVWYDWREIGSGERGSNSNGEWVRNPDGTQICWKETPINNAFDTYGASTWENTNRTSHFTWTFPAAFTGTPAVSGSANLSGAGSGSRRGSTVGFDGADSTMTKYQVFQIGSSKFTGTAYISFIAIGRWK